MANRKSGIEEDRYYLANLFGGMDEWVSGWAVGWLDEWMVGWVGRWTDGRTDG